MTRPGASPNHLFPPTRVRPAHRCRSRCTTVLKFLCFVCHESRARHSIRPVRSSDRHGTGARSTAVCRLSALEQRIHESINAERVRNRLPGLELDQALSRIARAHSLDMATRDFFDHVNPEGKTPSDRGDAGGFSCRKGLPDGSYAIGLAENLFQNNLYDRIMFVDGKASYAWNSLEHIAATTVQGWMKSRGHRTNILNRSHGRSGIGIAPDTRRQGPDHPTVLLIGRGVLETLGVVFNIPGVTNRHAGLCRQDHGFETDSTRAASARPGVRRARRAPRRMPYAASAPRTAPR